MSNTTIDFAGFGLPGDEVTPFRLHIWPMLPLENTRAGRDGPESVKGDLLARMEELGLAENTVVVVNGDNGHVTK